MANRTISFEVPEELAVKLSVYIAENAANRSALLRKLVEDFLAKESKPTIKATYMGKPMGGNTNVQAYIYFR